jgi:hypothetical protein
MDIIFVVNVPVLSLHITVVHPSVSTDVRVRTMAFSLAILLVPSAKHLNIKDNALRWTLIQTHSLSSIAYITMTSSFRNHVDLKQAVDPRESLKSISKRVPNANQALQPRAAPNIGFVMNGARHFNGCNNLPRFQWSSRFKQRTILLAREVTSVFRMWNGNKERSTVLKAAHPWSATKICV